MELNADQLTMLKEWYESKAAADAAVEQERALRTKLVTALFNASKDEGSQIIKINGGWKLKATKPMDYKLENGEGETLALCALLGDEQSRKLIKWKPELFIGPYKELDKNTQTLFDGILNIKPGMAQLELIPPVQ